MSSEQDLREGFALFDKKGDGLVASSEIGTVLRALGQNPTEADVKKIKSQVDPKGDKRISFEEFLPIFNSVSQKKVEGSEQTYIEGLRVFDKDGNGTMSAAELRHVLTSLGEKLSGDDVDIILNAMQVHADGSVNYEDFVHLVMGV